MGNFRVLLFYFFFSGFIYSFSQNNFKPVKWDTIPAFEIRVNPAFSGYDNVILKEKNICSFTEEDSIVMTVLIQYKVNTEKG
ncbi:MAG: hypothetical protein IAF38_06845, partial [Bacteroidia bacterium]|nr:hypothetical protein [Bacteroidia bacterium]